jgi:hypothetical protein
VGLVSLAVAGSASGRGRPTDPPRASAAVAVVLGSASFAQTDGSGFGSAHPAEIFNGGDPSGLVTHIHWTGWGDPVATGRGRNAIFMPQGGYYPQLVTIELRASNRGRCTPGGPLAYRRLSVRVPARPGGKLGPWVLWSLAPTICSAP